MGKWQRSLYQPVLPLGKDGKRVTGSAEHIALSRKAAGEGMVLVKNENDTLPLAKGTKVALFGKGTIDYVKGGGGSGDVTVEYIRNFYEGMKIKEAKGEVSLFHELPEFYEKNVKEQYAAGAVPGMTREPEVPDELVQKAKAYTDTAIITICRFSGEGWDRKCQITEEGYELFEDEKKQIELSASIFENGDFCLTNGEAAMVEKVKANFKNVIVVMNVGGMVDTSWFKDCKEISAVLMAWQGGMEGGLAAADVVTGDVNPSGKLVDTYAATLEDYPSTENFHKSVYYVDYNEDIYVGYRYFETIPGAAEKVNYPFGFGLSYTSFETEVLGAEEKDGKIVVKAAVTNTGKRAGKEVVQLYYGAPQGKLGKPAKELGAYRKTRLLQAGESQTIVLSFAINDMASFDDLGKIAKSAYILEAGSYVFYVGNNVRDAKKLDFTYDLAEAKVTAQYTSLAAPHKLEKRLLADGTYEALPTDNGPVEEEGLERQDKLTLEGFLPAVKAQERKSFGELMEAAKNGLDRILTCAAWLQNQSANEGELTNQESEVVEEAKKYVGKFEAAMEDDFNTADAVSAIFEIVRESNSTVKDFSADYAKKVLKVLEDLCSVLGIETTKEEEILDEEIEKLIEERQAARKNKDFARADEIRDQLLEQGIVLKDTREGVKWSRA